MKKITFKLGELFCGPGGIALGASNSIIKNKDTEFSIHHTWANDYHEDTCKTYKHNFPDVEVICGDVKKLNIKSLPNKDGSFKLS
jgi:DNA (cytosine-5)-methyltransferase 1